jgi:ATP-dependent Lon protease
MTDHTQILQQEIQALQEQVKTAKLPDEMQRKMLKEIVALERSVELGSYDEKYEKVSRYIDWILKIPWVAESQDTMDIEQAKKVFN